jgi:uncharacterized protein YbaP (TraB family)
MTATSPRSVQPNTIPQRRGPRLKAVPRLIVIACLVFFHQPTLAAYTATAVTTNQPQSQFNSGAQANRALAAQAALHNCRQALAVSNPTNSVCELAFMDDQPVAAAATIRASTDNAPLYLWRFDSASATVFIAGTVHVLKEALHPLPRQFEQAYYQTEKLVLEVDLSRYPPAEVNAKTLAYARLGDQSLRQVMPAALYDQLVQAGMTYGLPVGQLQAYQPMLAFQQLTLLGMAALGYEGDFGVEHVIGQLGQRGREDILQLESLDFQLNLLFNQPIDTQLAVLDQALSDLPELESSISQLMTAYFQGNDDALLAILTAQTGDHPLAKAFNDQLIDQRNRGMAKKIAGYLETPHSYLVLVGAGHLVGPSSIIAELARAGIHGQRIGADQSIHHPVHYPKHHSTHHREH